MKILRFILITFCVTLISYLAFATYLMHCKCIQKPFTSEIFTEQEIQSAMDIALESAESTLGSHGANILSVSYAGDNDWDCKKIDGKSSIIIYTTFYAGPDADVSMNPYLIDKHWHYTLEKNNDSEWEIVNFGRM